MLIIISPAKSLDMDQSLINIQSTKPLFPSETENLIAKCKEFSERDLVELMNISDKLAKLNFDRYQDFYNQVDKSALMAFNGDVYSKIDSQKYNEEQYSFAQNHLRILSGLYGILRPLDEIRAHRLEMGTAIDGKVLSKYWQANVTTYINEELNKQTTPILINLASVEYFAVIDKKKINHPILNINFKEHRKGKLTTIALNAKRARGMMVDLIIKQNIDQPKLLKAFGQEGYSFSSDLSDEGNYTFVR